MINTFYFTITLSSTLVHNTQSSSIFDVILYEREYELVYSIISKTSYY